MFEASSFFLYSLSRWVRLDVFYITFFIGFCCLLSGGIFRAMDATMRGGL